MFHPKKILVPVDLSKESLLSLEWALTLCKQEQHPTLILVHVFPIVPVTGPEGMISPSYTEQDRKIVKSKIERWADSIPKGISKRIVYTDGSVAAEVLHVADIEKAEMIVITTHGRKGFSHFLYGSVAEEVVRKATCPVLVLHMNAKAIEKTEHTIENAEKKSSV